jgi:AhpD family alkylhydroperoxidase
MAGISVKFKNTRFNPDTLPFVKIAEEMAKAYGYTATLNIDKELAQLIRLRIATVNQCSYCSILHHNISRELPIQQEKIDCLNSYWESELYSEKEKAALAYTDSLNIGKGKAFEEAHEQLLRFFLPDEIAEIAAIIINMNVWTRLKLAQGAVPY